MLPCTYYCFFFCFCFRFLPIDALFVSCLNCEPRASLLVKGATCCENIIIVIITATIIIIIIGVIIIISSSSSSSSSSSVAFVAFGCRILSLHAFRGLPQGRAHLIHCEAFFCASPKTPLKPTDTIMVDIGWFLALGACPLTQIYQKIHWMVGLKMGLLINTVPQSYLQLQRQSEQQRGASSLEWFTLFVCVQPRNQQP